MAEFFDDSDQRVLRVADVLKQVRISKTQLYRMINCGAFPAPKKLSARITVWQSKTISDWLRQKLEGGAK